MNEARVDVGSTLSRHKSGRWAAEQLHRGLKEGKQLSAGLLRTGDTLRKDEWIEFDNAVIEEAIRPMVGVGDLVASGLTIPIPNSMGKTVLQWQTMADMTPAITSLSGVDRSENDAAAFELAGVPLALTHKDFDINIRTLAASRNIGEPLDTLQARVSGRLVAEQVELMLFQGGPTFGGLPIYGYTTHPHVNRYQFAGGEAWDVAGHTGEEILADVLAMIQKLITARMFGPYVMYIPSAYSVKMSEDFKTNSDKSIRERLLQIDSLRAIRVAHQLPANTVVIVQMTRDVVAMAMGEPIQTVQWDYDGGFVVKFKVFTIQIPVIRSTDADRSGVVVGNLTGAA